MKLFAETGLVLKFVMIVLMIVPVVVLLGVFYRVSLWF